MKKHLFLFTVVVIAFVLIIRFGIFRKKPGIADRPDTAKAITINDTNFPDRIFCDHISIYDKNKDGLLSSEEIDDVEEIDLVDQELYGSGPFEKISSMKGLEYFTSLKRLVCCGRGITDLDLSRNTKLEYLNCSGNNLTTLDVSKNTELTELYCGLNSLEELDMSHNTKLTTLYCHCNKIKELDLSHCQYLTDLKCGLNKLTLLDLSNIYHLQNIDCEPNPDLKTVIVG